MAHTIICPFYRVLGDMVEGDCKTTIEEAKADWYQEFRQYWSEEYDGGAGNEVPGMSDAKAQEDAQLVAGQTEAGINTATTSTFQSILMGCASDQTGGFSPCPGKPRMQTRQARLPGS